MAWGRTSKCSCPFYTAINAPPSGNRFTAWPSGSNRSCGHWVRKTLIWLFRLRWYPAVGLLSRIWYDYLSWNIGEEIQLQLREHAAAYQNLLKLFQQPGKVASQHGVEAVGALPAWTFPYRRTCPKARKTSLHRRYFKEIRYRRRSPGGYCSNKPGQGNRHSVSPGLNTLR